MNSTSSYRDFLLQDTRFTEHSYPVPGETTPIVLLHRNSHDIRYDATNQQSKDIEVDTIPQFIWPATHLLAAYIASHGSHFADRTVLELGSGVGFTGLLAARHCSNVILTDYSNISLDLLRINMELNACDNVRIARLKWGEADGIKDLLRSVARPVDLIIGADIFYHRRNIRPLFETIRMVLAGADTNVEDQKLAEARTNGGAQDQKEAVAGVQRDAEAEATCTAEPDVKPAFEIELAPGGDVHDSLSPDPEVSMTAAPGAARSSAAARRAIIACAVLTDELESCIGEMAEEYGLQDMSAEEGLSGLPALHGQPNSLLFSFRLNPHTSSS